MFGICAHRPLCNSLINTEIKKSPLTKFKQECNFHGQCGYQDHTPYQHIKFNYSHIFCEEYALVKLLHRDNSVSMFTRELHVVQISRSHTDFIIHSGLIIFKVKSTLIYEHISSGQNLNGKWGHKDVTQINANPKLTADSKALLLYVWHANSKDLKSPHSPHSFLPLKKILSPMAR